MVVIRTEGGGGGVGVVLVVIVVGAMDTSVSIGMVAGISMNRSVCISMTS